MVVEVEFKHPCAVCLLVGKERTDVALHDVLYSRRCHRRTD